MFKTHLQIIVLLIICGLALLINVGSYGVVETSDARYAEIGREMFTSGDYIHPNLLDVHHYHKPPITYQLITSGRNIIERNFNPEFNAHLYFVFLNKKQNSREGIANYKKNKNHSTLAIAEINAITNDMIGCNDLKRFQFLMQNHERIIADIIKQTPVKDLLFKDFEGSIKSLGAWGGDFVLVASEDDPQPYFKKKGFNTIIPYRDMIL